MRRIQLMLIFGLLIACNQQDTKSLFENYIDGYYKHGFESISNLFADTITILDIDGYKAIYPKQDFKIFYQWDSVFKPTYELISLTYTDSTVDVIQSVSSERFEFLGNNPLKTRHRMYFDKGLITKIENMEYLNVDWVIWVEKRDSLVNWIDSNHQELSGFINDMTKKGAEDYIKAIELYLNAQ